MNYDLASFHFHYVPRSGHIYWRVPTSRKTKRWSEAGSICKKGYRYIVIRGKRYAAHRLAWLLYYREWPKYSIDHINRNPADNRINNLRDVPHRENMRNRKVQTNNQSGLAGVQWRPRRRHWEAFIHIDRRNHCIGCYPTLLDAAAARRSAEIKHEFYPARAGE